MNKLENDRYLRSLLLQPVDRTPIWIMRQAGRYLPEYRKIRSQVRNFVELYRCPQLACEVALQPLRRYPLDAAILFSDILTVPDAMGMNLFFSEKEGPKFDKVIFNKSDVVKLPVPDPEEDMGYVMDTIRLIKQQLNGKVPLIGFSGSPWTIAAYMVEGGGSKSFTKIKKMLYSSPETLHLLLDKLADSIILYLNAQIFAGVQAIMLFDTWGGLLTTQNYLHFSLCYIHKIVDSLFREHECQYIPVTLYTKGGNQWIEQQVKIGCDALGLDWTVDIGRVRRQVGNKVALQGNLDPAALYGSSESLEQQVSCILSDYGKGSGHIFNLGHGIYPDTPLENVSVLIDTVLRLSPNYHEIK